MQMTQMEEQYVQNKMMEILEKIGINEMEF
jgi:hypothetical protein